MKRLLLVMWGVRFLAIFISYLVSGNWIGSPTLWQPDIICKSLVCIFLPRNQFYVNLVPIDDLDQGRTWLLLLKQCNHFLFHIKGCLIVTCLTVCALRKTIWSATSLDPILVNSHHINWTWIFTNRIFSSLFHF